MVGRSDYEERKEERIDRYRYRAEKNREESESRHNAARTISSFIPFGQPILIGHHSEKRHRRDLDKIDNNMRKSCEASDKAAYHDAKADAAESNRAISSDDPEAIVKLKEKLADLLAQHANMKAVNAAHRKYVKNSVSLDASGLSEADKIRIRNYKSEYSWEPNPYPPYALSNRNANIKRVRERIVSLEELDKAEHVETEHDGFTVVENVDENRVQVIFPGKPSAEIRKLLKGNGFRWSPRAVAWQRQLNNAGRYAAKQVVEELEND